MDEPRATVVARTARAGAVRNRARRSRFVHPSVGCARALRRRARAEASRSRSDIDARVPARRGGARRRRGRVDAAPVTSGYFARMSDYEIPPPEPKEIDEQNWLELRDLMHRAVLKGEPYLGKERCGNCLYYLNTDDDV